MDKQEQQDSGKQDSGKEQSQQQVQQPVGDPPKTPAPGGMTWQEALEDAAKSRDKAKAELRTTMSELEKYRTQEAQRRRADEEQAETRKREQLEQQGKYAEALRMSEDRNKQEIDKVRSRVSEKLVPLAIKSAASSVENIAPESIDDLPQLLRDKIALDPETMEVYVKGDDGKPLVDDKLQPVPVDKFVRDWVQQKPYLLLDGMPKRHGQRPGADGKIKFEQVMNDQKLYDQWKAEDPEGLRAAEDAYWNPAAVKARLRAGKK